MLLICKTLFQACHCHFQIAGSFIPGELMGSSGFTSDALKLEDLGQYYVHPTAQ